MSKCVGLLSLERCVATHGCLPPFLQVLEIICVHVMVPPLAKSPSKTAEAPPIQPPGGGTKRVAKITVDSSGEAAIPWMEVQLGRAALDMPKDAPPSVER